MAKTIAGEIWVCVDCMFVAVNGESEGHDESQPEPWSWWDATETPDISPDFDSETDDGHDTFSWRRCDGCKSTLGGDRYRFVWWE